MRNTDIGLLYDPSRTLEKNFCKTFKNLILQEDREMKIRYNYPYLGKADGLTSYLRKKFPENYSGIELEVNQRFVSDDKMHDFQKRTIIKALKGTLKEIN